MASSSIPLESLVIVHNVAKRHNVGTLARSATAFGVTEMILIGKRDFNSFGSHGSTSHLRFRHFHSLSDARHYLKVIKHQTKPFLLFFLTFNFDNLFSSQEERDCDICGVEIADGAVSIEKHPFRKSTAFLLGNEVYYLSYLRSNLFCFCFCFGKYF